MTLGLFSFVINAVLLVITDALMDHLSIDAFFWTAMSVVVIMVIVSMVLHVILAVLLEKPRHHGLRRSRSARRTRDTRG